MNRILWVLVAFVVVSSFILGIHNASIYAPNHGFDGSGHVYYIQYVAKHWTIPPPTEWETHQPPLYYIIGAAVMTIFGTFRSAHYINIFVLWLIIGVVGLGLRKIFKDKIQVLLGMFSLAALPMLNIFPAMITNELLSTFFIISASIASLYLLSEKKRKKITIYLLWLGTSLVLGIWTKISEIIVLPTIGMGIFLLLKKRKIYWKKIVLITLFLFIVISLFSSPVFIRVQNTKTPSNISNSLTKDSLMHIFKQSPAFYFRLDWIPKVDMYNTQYYSLLGGGWNSFWSDGHNTITPFIKFHKKAFILWSLGFFLLPLSLFGLIKLHTLNKEISIIINTLGLSMMVMYIYYGSFGHYSSVRLTYEMAIVVPYAFGIAGAAHNKRMKVFLFILLSIQFIILLSFFWILSWWHVTR